MAATIQLAVLALALGLDSFRVSLGVGAAGRFRGFSGQLVCAFGVCDGVAFAVGVAVGRSLAWMAGGWVNALGPPALASYALYVLWLARKESDDEGRFVLGLPLVLSFDNLAVGGTLGGLSVLPAALLVGAASAALALAGLVLGRRAVEVVRLRPELAGAALLLGASALSFYSGG
jgi:putative Mn2+ efflux pump MntP